MMNKFAGAKGILLLMAVAPWSALAQTSGSPASSATSGAPSFQSGTAGTQIRDKSSSGFAERRPRYRVEPSDVLDLNFPYTPDFNQTITVQPDGYVSLREVGNFYVQGKTTPELEAALKDAYAKILRDPVVSVDLKNFQTPYFIVGGQVAHPGKYDLRADTTATEAVAIAGGLTEDSKHSEVILFRRISPDTVEAKKLNMKKMLNSANLDEDMYLRPGDMLYVPKNTMGKIRRFLPYEAVGTYMNVPIAHQ
jgi:protein involved in polysaccharide export with SLBB domain